MSALMKKPNGVFQIQSVCWSSNNHTSVDGYQILAGEIIRLAALDYKKELIKSKKGKTKTRECYRLERFFRSAYGQSLCLGMGEYIMGKVQKEVEDEAHA